MQMPWRRRVIGLVVLALWFDSLFLPALQACDDVSIPRQWAGEWYPGWYVLMFGLFGLSFGNPGWFANFPLLTGAGVLLWGRAPGRIMACIGLALAAMGFLPLEVWPNEAMSFPVCARGPGFWLWFTAFVLVFLAAFHERRRGNVPRN